MVYLFVQLHGFTRLGRSTQRDHAAADEDWRRRTSADFRCSGSVGIGSLANGLTHGLPNRGSSIEWFAPLLQRVDVEGATVQWHARERLAVQFGQVLRDPGAPAGGD